MCASSPESHYEQKENTVECLGSFIRMHYMFWCYLASSNVILVLVLGMHLNIYATHVAGAFALVCDVCAVYINTWFKIYAKWPNQTMKIGDKCTLYVRVTESMYLVLSVTWVVCAVHELLLHLSYDNTKTINNIIIKNRRDFIFVDGFTTVYQLCVPMQLCTFAMLIFGVRLRPRIPVTMATEYQISIS